jgi:hypothetical protein
MPSGSDIHHGNLKGSIAMSAVYDDRTVRGTITATAAGFRALDASGKLLGTFATAVEAASAVLRESPPLVDPDAELAREVERFMHTKVDRDDASHGLKVAGATKTKLAIRYGYLARIMQRFDGYGALGAALV